ncbi:DUF4276 family protein [Pseudoduganella sp. LjRoot289]|uniref:DUF4276 family protein n=1 Tax=Pseudoduganella sp. LjRoot289 TaxID=3342314 RepID=UPI003ED0D34B
MIRIHVICEGQTEEMFVNEVLADVFLIRGICLIPALIGKPGHKGGNFKFERLLTDVRARLLDDKTAYCTTFFDFYGLPEDFPGKEKAKGKNGISQKADCLLSVLTEKLRTKLGDGALRRFIPYVQMYEFEGLLFSHPEKLAKGINQNNLSGALQKIRDAFDSPEHINNSPVTAPSKRIEELYSAYDKPIHGSLAAIEIGLDVIRKECGRFDEWLKRLEALQPKEPDFS